MKKQHESPIQKKNNHDSRKGQRGLSCCNEVPNRCPFLVFQREEDEDAAIDELARILAGIFFRSRENERRKEQQD